VLFAQGQTAAYVTVSFKKQKGAAETDWIGVFSPAKFNGSECLQDLNATYYDDTVPFLCSSPIKFQYANFSSPDYVKTGSGLLTFRLIKQRADFAFGFFSGDLTDVSSFNPIHKLQHQPFFFETGPQLSVCYKSKIVITLLLHLGI
jgi:hypothetical protein